MAARQTGSDRDEADIEDADRESADRGGADLARYAARAKDGSSIGARDDRTSTRDDDTDEADRDKADRAGRADQADADEADRLTAARRLVDGLSEQAGEQAGERAAKGSGDDERTDERALARALDEDDADEDGPDENGGAESSGADDRQLLRKVGELVEDARSAGRDRDADSPSSSKERSSDENAGEDGARERAGEFAAKAGEPWARFVKDLTEDPGKDHKKDGDRVRDPARQVSPTDDRSGDRSQRDRAEQANAGGGARESRDDHVERGFQRLRERLGDSRDGKDGEGAARDVVERVTAELADRAGQDGDRQRDRAGEARAARGQDDDAERWVQNATRKALERSGADDAEQPAGDLARRVSERVVSELTERSGSGRRDDDGTRGEDATKRGDDGDVTDAVRGLVREAVRFAADRSGVSEDDVHRMAGTADAASAEKSGWAQLLDAAGAEGHRDADEQTCAQGGDGCGASTLRTRDVSLLGSRGPPQGERSQQYDAELFSVTDEESDRDTDRDADDSAEQTDRVLEGRIEVDNSKDRLAEEKKKVTSGEVSAAQYKKDEAEHEELTRQVEADRAELSPERVELVDEVVDGHQELSEREAELTAEEKKVAAGAADKKTHARNVAEFEAQRDEVYEATDELMAATDQDPDVVPEDGVDGEGSVAGCGSSGSFVECGSVSEDDKGERDSDRCVALSGVSSGCGVSTKSGDNESSASCDLSGADQGCGSSASGRDDEGTVSKASAWCSGDARECGQHSITTPEGAAASCDSGGGSCRSDSTGPDRDAATPPDSESAKSAERRTAAWAACTGECGVDSFADRSVAEADCDTAGGTCGSSSTGSGTERPEVASRRRRRSDRR